MLGQNWIWLFQHCKHLVQFKHDRNQLTVPANLCLQATDPDAGETEALQYSLVEPSNLFAVDPSSGQVYVVSAAGESGKITLQVKAEDKLGLHDITTLEVSGIWTHKFKSFKI